MKRTRTFSSAFDISDNEEKEISTLFSHSDDIDSSENSLSSSNESHASLAQETENNQDELLRNGYELNKSSNIPRKSTDFIVLNQGINALLSVVDSSITLPNLLYSLAKARRIITRNVIYSLCHFLSSHRFRNRVVSC